MGYRVVKRGRGPFRYSKSYPSMKKAERARKRLRGRKVVKS
jgi:hypothetical protein